MKNRKGFLMVLSLLLAFALTSLTFAQEIGIDPVKEDPIAVPKRAITALCGNHTCDNGLIYPYYKTACAVGTNRCTPQTCDEALVVIIQNYCN